MRSDIPPELDEQLERSIRKSLALSFQNPAKAMPYIKSKAMEMDETVIRQHIKTFLNDFTIDLGEAGMRAVNKLQEIARAAGILP